MKKWVKENPITQITVARANKAHPQANTQVLGKKQLFKKRLQIDKHEHLLWIFHQANHTDGASRLP